MDIYIYIFVIQLNDSSIHIDNEKCIVFVVSHIYCIHGCIHVIPLSWILLNTYCHKKQCKRSIESIWIVGYVLLMWLTCMLHISIYWTLLCHWIWCMSFKVQKLYHKKKKKMCIYNIFARRATTSPSCSVCTTPWLHTPALITPPPRATPYIFQFLFITHILKVLLKFKDIFSDLKILFFFIYIEIRIKVRYIYIFLNTSLVPFQTL